MGILQKNKLVVALLIWTTKTVEQCVRDYIYMCLLYDRKMHNNCVCWQCWPSSALWNWANFHNHMFGQHFRIVFSLHEILRFNWITCVLYVSIYERCVSFFSNHLRYASRRSCMRIFCFRFGIQPLLKLVKMTQLKLKQEKHKLSAKISCDKFTQNLRKNHYIHMKWIENELEQNMKQHIRSKIGISFKRKKTKLLLDK